MRDVKKMLRGGRLVFAGVGLLAMIGLVWAADNALSGASGLSMLKDLHITQLPMVIREELEGASGGAVGTTVEASPGGTLAVMASVDRDDSTYAAGDTVTLAVEVTEDAYVWVFDTGTSGKVHRIFPNEFDGQNFVQAGRPVLIPGPDANYDFQVSHPAGLELLTVIASKNDAVLAEDLVADASIPGIPFVALRGDAELVAKDISVSLREEHPVWASDVAVIRVE